MPAKTKGSEVRTAQVNMRFPESLRDELRAYAERHDITMSDVMILALQKYMNAPETFKPVPVRQSYKGAPDTTKRG